MGLEKRGVELLFDAIKAGNLYQVKKWYEERGHINFRQETEIGMALARDCFADDVVHYLQNVLQTCDDYEKNPNPFRTRWPSYFSQAQLVVQELFPQDFPLINKITLSLCSEGKLGLTVTPHAPQDMVILRRVFMYVDAPIVFRPRHNQNMLNFDLGLVCPGGWLNRFPLPVPITYFQKEIKSSRNSFLRFQLYNFNNSIFANSELNYYYDPSIRKRAACDENVVWLIKSIFNKLTELLNTMPHLTSKQRGYFKQVIVPKFTQTNLEDFHVFAWPKQAKPTYQTWRLYNAIFECRPNEVLQLLQAGTDTNQPHADSYPLRTAIYHAADRSRGNVQDALKIIDLLLFYGADPNFAHIDNESHAEYMLRYLPNEPAKADYFHAVLKRLNYNRQFIYPAFPYRAFVVNKEDFYNVQGQDTRAKVAEDAKFLAGMYNQFEKQKMPEKTIKAMRVIQQVPFPVLQFELLGKKIVNMQTKCVDQLSDQEKEALFQFFKQHFILPSEDLYREYFNELTKPVNGAVTIDVLYRTEDRDCFNRSRSFAKSELCGFNIAEIIYAKQNDKDFIVNSARLLLLDRELTRQAKGLSNIVFMYRGFLLQMRYRNIPVLTSYDAATAAGFATATEIDDYFPKTTTLEAAVPGVLVAAGYEERYQVNNGAVYLEDPLATSRKASAKPFPTKSDACKTMFALLQSEGWSIAILFQNTLQNRCSLASFVDRYLPTSFNQLLQQFMHLELLATLSGQAEKRLVVILQHLSPTFFNTVKCDEDGQVESIENQMRSLTARL